MNNLLSVCRKEEGSGGEMGGGDDMSRLQCCGEFHLGDMVNIFRSGSLGMPNSDKSDKVTNESTSSSEEVVKANVEPLLFGTVGGMLGSIVSIDETTYHLFTGLQRAIGKVRPLKN